MLESNYLTQSDADGLIFSKHTTSKVNYDPSVSKL